MDEPKWLNRREARAWRGYRQMSLLLHAQLARDLARETGLSDADYTVLVALSESPQHRMRLVELTRRTLWSKSRLSHQLTRMQQRGLIRREACAEHPANSRAIDAVLTADGLRVIQEAAPRHLDSVRRHFIDQLTDDQIDALGDAADAVVHHLQAHLHDEDQSGREETCHD